MHHERVARASLTKRSFTLSSVVPGEIAPLILLPCFATLNTLVAGMLVTRSTLPVIWRWCVGTRHSASNLLRLLLAQVVYSKL